MTDRVKCDICHEERSKYKLSRHIEKTPPKISELERARIVLRHKQEGKNHSVEEYIQCQYTNENGDRCQSFVQVG